MVVDVAIPPVRNVLEILSPNSVQTIFFALISDGSSYEYLEIRTNSSVT